MLGCAGTESSSNSSSADIIDLKKFESVSTITFDNIVIPGEKLPAGYQSSSDLMCKSIQPATLYQNPNIYAALIGSCTSKQHISYAGPGNDRGTILYLEFAGGVSAGASAFLGSLMWGQAGKPTGSHPEEIFFAKNAIVIWSFGQVSTAKQMSKSILHDHLNGSSFGK
jgi:hypothetical protein